MHMLHSPSISATNNGFLTGDSRLRRHLCHQQGSWRRARLRGRQLWSGFRPRHCKELWVSPSVSAATCILTRICSKRVQQQVNIYHDAARHKYRLCPGNGHSGFGTLIPKSDSAHIPRPPNRWILYRQAMSKVVSADNRGLKAGEICKSAPSSRHI